MSAAAFALILLMAAVTYATRIAGVAAMSFVTVTPRIAVFLKALTSSVLVAIVVPAVIHGGRAGWIAVAVAAAIVFARLGVSVAIVGGIAAAAIARQFGL